MSVTPPLFGYGSLILPPSLISRFRDVTPSIDAVYRGDTPDIIRRDAIEEWEALADRLTLLPVKVYGYQRYYSIASDRGNTMLELVKSDVPDAFVNGVLIVGLTDAEETQVKGTESMYDYTVVENPRLEWYVPDDEVAGIDVGDISSIRLFASKKHSDDIVADAPRNETYHTRIVNGIEMLDGLYETSLFDAFYTDFCETTYERAYDSNDPAVFNTVAENNALREAAKKGKHTDF